MNLYRVVSSASLVVMLALGSNTLNIGLVCQGTCASHAANIILQEYYCLPPALTKSK